MDAPNPSKITNQTVAIICILSAVAMCFGAFWLSRADHDLKLMSLQSVLTLGGTLTGIAGTLLVGVNAYKQIATGDLPPGSSVNTSEQSSIKVPPATPSATPVTTSNNVVPPTLPEAPK